MHSRVCAPACDHTHRRSVRYLRRPAHLLRRAASLFAGSIRCWRRRLGGGDSLFEFGQLWDRLGQVGIGFWQVWSCRAPGVCPNSRALGRRTRPVPRVPSQVLLHCARRFRALAELLGPLRSRRDAAGAGADAARPAARGGDDIGAYSLSKVQARLIFSTSGPQGPRRRLRGRVPGNTGRRAGGARGARAQEQVQVGASCGARIAR